MFEPAADVITHGGAAPDGRRRGRRARFRAEVADYSHQLAMLIISQEALRDEMRATMRLQVDWWARPRTDLSDYSYDEIAVALLEALDRARAGRGSVLFGSPSSRTSCQPPPLTTGTAGEPGPRRGVVMTGDAYDRVLALIVYPEAPSAAMGAFVARMDRTRVRGRRRARSRGRGRHRRAIVRHRVARTGLHDLGGRPGMLCRAAERLLAEYLDKSVGERATRSGYLAIASDALVRYQVNALFRIPEIREEQLRMAHWAARSLPTTGNEWEDDDQE